MGPSTARLHVAESWLTGRPLFDAALLVVFLASLVSFVRSWHRLSHVPGPFLRSVSSLPTLRANLGGRAHEALYDLTKTYGPIVRTGPNSVITTDVRHIQKMEAAKSTYVKGPWYATFSLTRGNDTVFSTVHERTHARLRSKVGPGYSSSVMVENAIDRQLGRLHDLIERKYTTRAAGEEYRPVDLAVLTQMLTLEVVGDMTYGRAFGFLDEGDDVYDWVRWNEDFFTVFSTAATLPFLSRLSYVWPLSLFRPKATDKTGLGRFIRSAEESAEARFQPGAEPQPDMLGIFQRCGATKSEAISEAILQIVAGTDSVAVAVRMTLLYVVTSPRVYQRLLAELDEASSSSAAAASSSAGDDTPPAPAPPLRESEARSLPYLQAVVREGLRVFPALTPLMEKTVPAGGDDFVASFASSSSSASSSLGEEEGAGGCCFGKRSYHLPAGTQVGTDVWGVLRSPRYWGADADVFRPERWVEAEEEAAKEGELAAAAAAAARDASLGGGGGGGGGGRNHSGGGGAPGGPAAARLAEMRACLEVIFGYGKFKCLGKSIAMMEINKILPELLRRYEFTIIEPTMPIKHMRSAAFWLMTGFMVTIAPRQPRAAARKDE